MYTHFVGLKGNRSHISIHFTVVDTIYATILRPLYRATFINLLS